MSQGAERASALEYQGLGTCNLMQSLDVGTWLEELGLGQYRALFSEQAIDHDVLPDLTDDDLVRLGMPLGHRKKLLKAIDDLLGRQTTEQHAPIRSTLSLKPVASTTGPPASGAKRARRISRVASNPSTSGIWQSISTSA